MAFKKFQLDPNIIKAIEGSGYTTPSKIQSEAIPEVLGGFDIRASAQTGTGKTAAFLLPALHKIVTEEPKEGKGPRVLVLAPTRELAAQIAQQSEKYSKYLQRAKTVCINGGVPYAIQMRKLSKPYDILIATPGRLIDYVERGKIEFSRLEILILDEADRMLDIGFVEPIRFIASVTPASRQTLLFSATLQGSVKKLSDEILTNPKDIIIHADKEKHENITQTLHYVDDIGHKNRLLERILSEKDVENAIIFTATKRHADKLSKELGVLGFKVAALHGDMTQGKRNHTVRRLKEGKINIIVATDVAARGIDIKSITHVINFDLPRVIEDYVHRIGRTGRAGAQGSAISFSAYQDVGLVRRIEDYTGHQIDVKELEGLEPSRKPSENRGGGGPRKRSSGGFKTQGRRERFKGKSSGGGFSSRGRGGSSRTEGSGDSRSSDSYGSKSKGGFGSRSSDSYGSKPKSGFIPKSKVGFGSKPSRGSKAGTNSRGPSSFGRSKAY